MKTDEIFHPDFNKKTNTPEVNLKLVLTSEQLKKQSQILTLNKIAELGRKLSVSQNLLFTHKHINLLRRYNNQISALLKTLEYQLSKQELIDAKTFNPAEYL